MTPAGYSYLIEQLHLEVPPNHHQSFIGKVREVVPLEGKTIFPKKYDPGNELIGHLVFGIKYDGINLCILSEAFKKIPQKEIEDFIISKPTGKYARKIWFLWEFLNEKRLDIGDLNQGNYLELLDSEEYFTSPKPKISSRHRILNNLLGNQRFCPVVRQIPNLKEFNLRAECSNLLSCYPKATLNRAVRYLNLKETRSSFAIENIFPNAFKSCIF